MKIKKYNFKGKRALKNDPMEIKKNDFALNPLTLAIIENNYDDRDLYFSNFYLNNNNLITTTYNKNMKIGNIDVMSKPSILIHHSDLLIMHNINNISDLMEYIDDNINGPFNYNNRIINCFIRDNYKDLSKNNKILSNIYLKLFKNYKIDKNIIDKFIKNWFKNNNSNSFFLNLGNDLENYLSKKYEP